MAQPPGSSRIITRLVDGRIRAYDLASPARGVLSPARIFRPRPGDEVVDHTASADLHRAVYTTLDAIVCVTRAGDEIWRAAFEPVSDRPHGHWPGCVLSPDGGVVWLYRPDAMAGRDRPDQWVALDALTGTVIAQADLGTAGHAGHQHPHPVDGHVLLEVGEGQDGVTVFRGGLADGILTAGQYPWIDRCLVALSPDGRQFMTIDHDQADVAFHAYPGGDAFLTLSVEDFGFDPDTVCFDWSGGFLTQDVAVVPLVGEDDTGEEWFRHFRIDVPAGRPEKELASHAEGADDLGPLGDGTWLTTDPSGHPVRHPVPDSPEATHP